MNVVALWSLASEERLLGFYLASSLEDSSVRSLKPCKKCWRNPRRTALRMGLLRGENLHRLVCLKIQRFVVFWTLYAKHPS